MRRLLRVALNLNILLCLLLSLATVALWVRSFWTRDYIAHNSEITPTGAQTRYGLVSNRGVIAYDRLAYAMTQRPGGWSLGEGWLRFEHPPDQHAIRHWYPDAREFLGFGYNSGPFPVPGMLGSELMIFAPHWGVALFFAISPSAWFLRRGRRRAVRRQAMGHCPICNYDLRATPERCPECGAVRRVGIQWRPQMPIR